MLFLLLWIQQEAGASWVDYTSHLTAVKNLLPELRKKLKLLLQVLCSINPIFLKLPIPILVDLMIKFP